MSVKVIYCLLLACVAAEYRNDGGFVPSFQRTDDQLAEASSRVEKAREERDSQPERTQRFGISAYGGGATGGFGSTAPGLYGPLKIDLGGVLIGSILGFGAVIILPKIIHALSYSYGGGYGRSVETDLSQMSDIFNKIDDMLSRYNIDSSACMQRQACSYVQLANENVVTGNATEFDAMLASMSSNSLVRRMLAGTSVLDAVTAGKSLDTDCHIQYHKCKLDKKTVLKMLAQLIPS
ncbi:hypothetical protein O3G_MSEX009124 [Manduca sexta]|uniref:Uncharacterized protein n=1 Tax=Manduca sexta TaxID=7130 RepID=A0A921ZC74_MANSE|nr:hypothetical protein O3G_MSEX009124 [Manduca sexta]